MISTITRAFRKLGFALIRDPATTQDLYSGYPQDSCKTKKFFNIGAGVFTHKYWTNIDYNSGYYKDALADIHINHNLMSLSDLPIESSTAEIVYCSHVIEHISNRAVEKLLEESFRILKPGGVLRLITPNAELAYRAYLNNDRLFFYWIDRHSQPTVMKDHYRVPPNKASLEQLFLHYFASQLSEIDIDDNVTKKYTSDEIAYIINNNTMEDAFDKLSRECIFKEQYSGSHINWWTPKKLTSFLVNSGFEHPMISAFGQSIAPPLRDITLFDNTHPKISLFMEAIKP